MRLTARGRLETDGPDNGGIVRSLRQGALHATPPVLGLLVLLVVVEVICGFPVLRGDWQGGDLLYHSALANAILRGEFLPGGPYQGLPTYYPPGFHLLLASAMKVTGLGPVPADKLLTLIWLPVLPIGTFLLTRRLTGRAWVALLAAVLTCFAGAYDLNAGRLWVNSLFMAGHEAYPLYPRDLVFGLIPFAVLAFIRSLDASSTRACVSWAVVGGVLFGWCGDTQVQLLLPLPFALIAAGVVAGSLGRGSVDRRRAVVAVVVTGIVAAFIVAPWLLAELALIRRNGGVALDSSDLIEPARFGFWSYPREFGFILPLGVIGAGLVFLRLRRPGGPHLGTTPGTWDRPLAGTAGARGVAIGLVAWAVLAFGLAVLYSPDWPFEDALRPQRLWLLASQPLTILAAIGLVAVAEDLVTRVRRPRWLVPLVTAVVLVAAVPTTVATAALVATTWTVPTYSHLDLTTDRVPDFAGLVGRTGPRATILTYEDWGALAWYEAGAWAVAIVPPGFAKLAYDPVVFTGQSQATRRDDLLTAFDGAPSDFTAVAAKYDTAMAVLARDAAGQIGVVDMSAASAAVRPGSTTGGATVVQGNGWDAVDLAAGSIIRFPVSTTAHLDLAIRVAAPLAVAGAAQAPIRQSFDVLAVGSGGIRVVHAVTVPGPTSGLPWAVVLAAVTLAPGETLAIRATDEITIQSIRGYIAAPADGTSPLPGWRMVKTTPLAAVLEREP